MSTYRTYRKPRTASPFQEVRAGDTCEIVTVTGAVVFGEVTEVTAAGVTVSHEVDMWPNGPTTRAATLPWKAQRRRTRITAGTGWASELERGALMSYGTHVNRRGRCIDAPCCGCCD